MKDENESVPIAFNGSPSSLRLFFLIWNLGSGIWRRKRVSLKGLMLVSPSQGGENRGQGCDASFDESMMAHALELATEARRLGEVPVGALVVRGRRILAQSFNLRETLNDPTAHAERLALAWAGQAIGSWRLDECVLYVTLEPCAMCAGAIVQSRIARLVYGATDPKAGACESLYRLVSDPRLNHRVPITSGILAHECGEVLKEFFQERRAFRKLIADSPE
jgi:tRNA(adenine34) deaminase